MESFFCLKHSWHYKSLLLLLFLHFYMLEIEKLNMTQLVTRRLDFALTCARIHQKKD